MDSADNNEASKLRRIADIVERGRLLNALSEFISGLGAINYLDRQHEHGHKCTKYLRENNISPEDAVEISRLADRIKFAQIDSYRPDEPLLDGGLLQLQPLIANNAMLFLYVDYEKCRQPNERRFWECANNLKFWRKFAKLSERLDECPSPARLVTVATYLLLTPSEPKLMLLNSLRMSVKHVDQPVRREECLANMKRMKRAVASLQQSHPAPYLLSRWRDEMFCIDEAERELEPIDVLAFIEKWNATLPKA